MEKRRLIGYRIWGTAVLVASFLLCGCRQAMEKKQQAGAAVELNGHYLYRFTLDSLTSGLRAEDSARVAEQYIRQWATDLLVQEQGESRMSQRDRAALNAMVADYKRTLYAQAYDERLVAARMPKRVDDTLVVAMYEQMPWRFKLEESIMRGMLVVLPKGAPKIEKLRTWMAKQEMDAIEKYAYQNASGYELFTEQWLTTTDMISHIPMERAELETKLKTKNQIEVSDSAKLYIVQITDKHMRGEAMPIDYARPLIEKIVLSDRQVEFLREERERMYKEAMDEQKIKFF